MSVLLGVYFSCKRKVATMNQIQQSGYLKGSCVRSSQYTSALPDLSLAIGSPPLSVLIQSRVLVQTPEAITTSICCASQVL